MIKKIQSSEEQKQQLISGIINEIDLMKTNLINRIKDIPDGSLSEFITPKKAAAILNISLPTLYKYTQQGLITRFRLGKRYYYRRNELLEAFEKQFLINKKEVDEKN